jgi:hypothetical protein
MAAWLNGILGLLLALALGIGILEMSWFEILRCILSANLAAAGALMLILKLEATPWVRKKVLTRSLKTWVVFTGVFLGILLALSPALREPRAFGWLILPLILSTGFWILLFGPIQDRLVARRQSRERARIAG